MVITTYMLLSSEHKGRSGPSEFEHSQLRLQRPLLLCIIESLKGQEILSISLGDEAQLLGRKDFPKFNLIIKKCCFLPKLYLFEIQRRVWAWVSECPFSLNLIVKLEWANVMKPLIWGPYACFFFSNNCPCTHTYAHCGLNLYWSLSCNNQIIIALIFHQHTVYWQSRVSYSTWVVPTSHLLPSSNSATDFLHKVEKTQLLC